MIEFCCTRCRRITREPSELHQGVPTTCTPCAVTATSPPPTVEYHRAPGGRYDWSMMLVAVGMASAGFIAGFLARGIS